jgi:hypothetical protein
MVTSHVLGAAWRDVDFVQSIGAGNPFAVRHLTRQLTLAGPDFDPRQVLTRQIEDELLAGLRQAWLGDRDLLAMAVLAATLRPRPRAAASVFKSLRWTDVTDADAEEAYVNELDIRNLFLSLMWGLDEDWLAIRPLPRLLLMRLLARDRTLWDRTHEGYLTYYRTQAVLDHVAEHHHLLALTTSSSGGNVGKVAAYLEKQFGMLNPSEWNAVLAAIATAPNRLSLADDGHHHTGEAPLFAGDPEDAVRRLAGVASPDDRLRTITRLVTARWLYNDRLFDPRRRLARLLDREYYELAQLTDGDSDAFYREVSRFRKIARNWEDR